MSDSVKEAMEQEAAEATAQDGVAEVEIRPGASRMGPLAIPVLTVVCPWCGTKESLAASWNRRIEAHPDGSIIATAWPNAQGFKGHQCGAAVPGAGADAASSANGEEPGGEATGDEQGRQA